MATCLAWVLAIQEGQVAVIKKIAMIFFFFVFLGIVVRLLMTRAGTYERASRLPLDDGRESTSVSGSAPNRHQPGEHEHG